MGCAACGGSHAAREGTSPRHKEANNLVVRKTSGRESRTAFFGPIKSAKSRCGTHGVTTRFHKRRIEDDYIVTSEVLGSGKNGHVFSAKSRDTGCRYAVKALNTAHLKTDDKQLLESELEISLALDHPHIVRLWDVYEDTNCVYLVMECMEGGEVYGRWAQERRLEESHVVGLAWQMLLAVNYLHSQGIVHRDLKLKNFLYQDRRCDLVKLIDFGFSRVAQQHMKLPVGTLLYAAPEVYMQDYDFQCDMWSLGVMVYIMLSGREPFKGTQKEIMKRIKNGEYIWDKEDWKDITQMGQDFVKALLVLDPRERLTAGQALKHPWIVNYRLRQSFVNPDDRTLAAFCEFRHTSVFKRASLLAMAWSLSSAEQDHLYREFLSMDKARKGVVTLEEFREVFRSAGHEDEAIEAAFQAVSGDHADKSMHYSDFLAAVMNTRVEMNPNLIHAAFRRLDTNADGIISERDLERVLGAEVRKSEIPSLMEEVRGERSGGISEQEFEAYIERMVEEKKELEQKAGQLGTTLKRRFLRLQTTLSSKGSFFEPAAPEEPHHDQEEPEQEPSLRGAQAARRRLSCFAGLMPCIA